MRHGSDWYKRYPQAYLGGVQGMSSKQHAVFSVVLELIYQHGGSVNNDPAWIAGWIGDMGAASVRSTIEQLVERGKLHIEGDQLTQKRAKTEAKTKENLSEIRAKAGQIGGKKSSDIRRRSPENKDLDEASASSKNQPDKRRVDKIPPNPQGGQPSLLPEDEKPPERRTRGKTVFAEEWRPDTELIAWAADRGFSAGDALRMAEACVNHHRAKGTLFADHRAAFRTWVSNEIKFKADRPPPPGSGEMSGILRRVNKQFGGSH